MKFYFIRNSENKKIMGNYPQVKEIKYNCNVWDEPTFIEHIEFKKIDFEPITANAILYSNSKVTDLINVTGMGFTRKLLVSHKLKEIIEKRTKTGLQFFKSAIIHKNIVIEDYWILNAYKLNMNCIDFKKSNVFLKEGLFDKLEKLNVSNIDEYEYEKDKIEKKGYPLNIFIEKIILMEDLDEHFLTINNVEGGVKYITSEKLKQEIEKAGCTGIEFQPIELSYNEWTAPAGEREKVYGKA